MPRKPLGERAMSPAERQRRYRERRRGGPAVGRWPASHKSQAELARAHGLSRTTMWKLGVVRRERPELAEEVVAGEMSVDRAFRLCRAEAPTP